LPIGKKKAKKDTSFSNRQKFNQKENIGFAKREMFNQENI
jgi:hypothetical protein